MRTYYMNYKTYAEIRLLSLPCYKQLFRQGDVFKVVDGNKKTVVIKSFQFE